MTLKATAQITLSSVIDVKATYRYYLLQSSTLTKPAKPSTFPPASTWGDVEPSYVDGSTNSLYFVDCTVFCDDTFNYSEVSLSSAYEAAKAAYNKAVNAQNGVNSLTTRVTNAELEIDKQAGEIALRVTRDEAVISPKVTDNQTRLVQITNALADSIENIKLFGKTTQDGTPTPDTPVDLVSIGDSSIDVTVAGKNLWDEETVLGYWQSSNGKFFSDPTQLASKNMIPVPPKIYVVSPAGILELRFYDRNQTYISDKTFYGATGTIELPVGACYMHIGLKPVYGTEYKNNVCISAVPTTYEPYKPLQTLTVATPNGLPGIPVTSGGNYTDSNGQQWVCDEVNLARGVYIKRLNKIVISSKTVNFGKYFYEEGANFVFWVAPKDIAKNGNVSAKSICSRFTYVRNIQNQARTIGTFSDNVGAYPHKYFCMNGVTTAQEAIDWFEANPTKLLYELETPIETALSAEELAAYAELSNDPGTVTVFSEAALEVELSGMASMSSVGNAQETANQANGRANDALDSIARAESTIQQLADSIAMLVRDGNGGSLLKQDSNGLWYFNIGGIEQSISDTANDLGDLNGTVNKANSRIDILNETAEALRSRTEYVFSGTDPKTGEPILLLGDPESPFSVRLSNTEMQFLEGTEIPARINRKMLIIEKAMVKQELQFGDDEVVDGVWTWQRRDNGNLGLSWKGVSS